MYSECRCDLSEVQLSVSMNAEGGEDARTSRGPEDLQISFGCADSEISHEPEGQKTDGGQMNGECAVEKDEKSADTVRSPPNSI